MIRRVGSYEFATGFTSQYSARTSSAVYGIQHTRLIGGHVVHLLCGRFGVYVGYWGPIIRPVVEVALGIDADIAVPTHDARLATPAAPLAGYRHRRPPLVS